MLPDFSSGAVLVIGDLMLDRYYIGSVNRISPEAPVPVVKVRRQSVTLGGAGNVANNLAHLGTPVTLAGPLGDDENGTLFTARCKSETIDLRRFVMAGPTITKTRVIGEHQQIVRIDVEEDLRWDPAMRKRVEAGILPLLRRARVAIISDYGKGFCAPELCRAVIIAAKKADKPVIVDPKGHDWAKYRGATIVTPNVKELSDIAGAPVPNTDDAVARYGKKVREQFALGALLVTRSEKGMTLIEGSGVHHVPTVAREVFDVSGAGDTVVATLAAALASGTTLLSAVDLANKAAGIVVGKVGTVPIERAELEAAVTGGGNSKIVGRAELFGLLEKHRSVGKRIVFTNGCFDILHRGNVHLLDEAKRCGDILVVALNSDASASRQKGRGRPMNTEHDRAHLVAAIDAVDYVTIFDETTPLGLIKKIRPDVLVKGGNFKKEQVLGREFARHVVIVPLLKGYSSAEIAERISGRV